jgi:3,4-dihydroxy 2-butanone 4-phosphate synthase/GTP cyclohydrolase II
MSFATIEAAVEDYRAGKFVIIVDDEDRENEGDLAIAAEHATPEAINFMARHGRGLICLPVIGQRLDELEIPMMVEDNTASFGTAFTVSIEARHGTTTGISAYDRARTVQAVLDPVTRPQDLRRPGHMFPLRAAEGGVLSRRGQTEASVDLARLAGLYPAAVICEIMSDDGTMARLPELERFAAEHALKIISVEQLAQYRWRHDNLVRCVAQTRLPTVYGEFRTRAYEHTLTGEHHIALIMGGVKQDQPILVRLHSECLTGEVFSSLRCDCGDQLRRAQTIIAQEGTGVILYLRQEGRGIGLFNKLKAYALQDQGLDTVEANIHLGFDPDPRDYSVAAQILFDLGIEKVRLLTNNPRKVSGLEDYGLEVTERVPLVVPANQQNRHYLRTKQEKMGHLLGV